MSSIYGSNTDFRSVLTSDELDDILEHIPEYKQKFAEEDRKAEEARLKAEKKPWWRKK